jgi:hypothetical protein
MTFFEARDASRYASQRATLRSMIPRSVVLVVFALALSGCKSYEGLYAPACAAYAGSEIRLEDGRFFWSKFTDQVVIDEDGNTVDPFPGFPREGAYAVDGETITLTPSSGEAPDTLYLVRDGADVYLLTAAENAEFAAGGELPRCALKRQVPGT